MAPTGLNLLNGDGTARRQSLTDEFTTLRHGGIAAMNSINYRHARAEHSGQWT